MGGGCGRGWDVHGDRDGLGAIGAEIGGGGRCGDGDTSETSARARGVGADEEGGQQAKLGGDCGEGADGQIAGTIGCEREGDRVSTDDLTTARAFGLAARVADLEDQLAKLRHYHFSTLLTLAAMAGGEIRVSKFDYQATRGLALATFVDPKTGDRVFVAKEAASDQSSPQAV